MSLNCHYNLFLLYEVRMTIGDIIRFYLIFLFASRTDDVFVFTARRYATAGRLLAVVIIMSVC